MEPPHFLQKNIPSVFRGLTEFSQEALNFYQNPSEARFLQRKMFPVTSVAQSGILLPTSFHRNDAIFHRNPSQGFFSSTRGDILGLILAEGVPVTQIPPEEFPLFP